MKNYYEKDDFDMQDNTGYTVTNDVNHHIPASMYESDYTIGSVKKQLKRSQRYEDDTLPPQTTDDINMPGSNSEGIGKSIVAMCFALVSVCILLFIAKLHAALKSTLSAIPLFSGDTTDFAAGIIGSQCYVYVGLAGVFGIISLILSILSIKTFVKGGSFGNSKPIATLVFAIIALILLLVAIVFTAMLFMGAPIKI